MLQHATTNPPPGAILSPPGTARQIMQRNALQASAHRPMLRTLLLRVPIGALTLVGLATVAEVGLHGGPSETLGTIVGNFERAVMFGHMDAHQTRANIDADAQARLKCLEGTIAYLSKGYEALYTRGTIVMQNVADIQKAGAESALQVVNQSQGANTTIAQVGDVGVALGMLAQRPDVIRLGEGLGKTFRDRSQMDVANVMRNTAVRAQQSLRSWNQGVPTPQDIAAITAAANGPACKPPAEPPPAPSPAYTHNAKPKP
jgi:hypothetical protein